MSQPGGSGRLPAADFQVRMPTAAPAGSCRNSCALLERVERVLVSPRVTCGFQMVPVAALAMTG